MDASKPKYAKQLKEHLQHQQEPFSLQSYLIERSYMFKNCNPDSSNFPRLYSAKNLKWSIKDDLHKIRKMFLHATGTLRSLLYKFIPTVDNQEFSNWDGEPSIDQYYVHEIVANTWATQQTDDLFSLKGLAASDHFTNNDVAGNVLPYDHHSSALVKLRKSQVDTGSEPYRISSKEIKEQQSRGSDWKEPFHNAGSTLSPKSEGGKTKIVTDPVFSTYLRKLLVNSNILKLRRAKKDKLQEIDGTASLCRRNRVVDKDRVFYENEGKNLSIKAVSESEDLRSIIHEHFSFLEKQYRQV